MRISVGIDIAKEAHWVSAVDADGVVRIDRKLANTPAAIASLIDELRQLGGPWQAADLKDPIEALLLRHGALS